MKRIRPSSRKTCEKDVDVFLSARFGGSEVLFWMCAYRKKYESAFADEKVLLEQLDKKLSVSP